MPTMDIIGYLWSKRQDLDLYSVPDAIQLAHDLVVAGLDCIEVQDIEVFGVSTGEVSVQWDRRTPEEWEPLVENAIAKAATEHVIHMFHQLGANAHSSSPS